MSAKTISLLSASAAPNRRHFAVPALLLAARAVRGSLASPRWHFLPFADVFERCRRVLPHPIVPARSDWLADSLPMHRWLRTLGNPL